MPLLPLLWLNFCSLCLNAISQKRNVYEHSKWMLESFPCSEDLPQTGPPISSFDFTYHKEIYIKKKIIRFIFKDHMSNAVKVLTCSVFGLISLNTLSRSYGCLPLCPVFWIQLKDMLCFRHQTWCPFNEWKTPVI